MWKADEVKIFSNHMVDLKGFVDFDPKEIGIQEWVDFRIVKDILENNTGDAIRDAFVERLPELTPKHITRDDILASINYLN